MRQIQIGNESETVVERADYPPEKIQSILGNYKFQQDRHTGPVYADFSVQGGPRVIGTAAGLPLDLQGPHVFVRKIAPKAHELLEQISAQLRAGLTIHGLEPREHKDRSTSQVIVGDSLLYRLRAPGASHSAPGPAWHGIESFGGRTYRWTALEEVVWELPEFPQHHGNIRFLITPVIDSRAEFRQGCQLSFAGRRMSLEMQEGNLTAEFPYSSSSADAKVVLTTPKLRSPREVVGAPDTRKLGLSIAT